MRAPLFGRIVRSFSSVAEHEYPAGLIAGSHYHEQSYLTVVTGGATIERFARRNEELRARDVGFMPAGERHSNEYIAPTRCIHLAVDPSLRVTPGPRRDMRTATLAGLIAEEVTTADDLSAIAVEGLLLALLARSARKYAGAPRWLANVIDVLHVSFSSRLTLSEISAIAGVHPAHLCREFHRFTGKTIGAYVRQLRVERARELLRRSDHSLAMIAFSCGFSDQSHFSSAFRKVTGMPPGRYRRVTTRGR